MQRWKVRRNLQSIPFTLWLLILLLPAVPAGFAIRYTGQNPVATFAVNFVAIIPLGRILDLVTKEMTIRRGGYEGMVIIITFNNAVQLVITIIALIKHQSPIVKTSLVGAVLSNTLLIVGMGFFLGGIYRIEQRFDPMTTGSSFNELILSVAALILPTAIRFFSNMDSRTIAKFSRAEAVLLFLSYICYICYSCKTHSIYFNAPHPRSARRTQGCKSHTGDAEKGLADVGAALALSSGGQTLQHMNWRRNERIPLPRMSSMALAVILTINTVILGFCTTFAVDSIDGLTQKTVLTQDFVGLILLPLLSCNVHAITLAIEDEMPQSFAISISSSVQLLLCILPLAVIVAWIRSDPTMNLLFDNFQVISLAISVMILRYITDDGRSNWLDGVVLMAFYAIIALTSWFSINPTLGRN